MNIIEFIFLNALLMLMKHSSKDEPVVGFSVEECSGRFLDLHDMYNKYISSDFGERVEYSAYLNVFSQLEKILRKLKLSRQYAEYMEALLEYLIYFFQRTEPLQDLDRILHKVETDFEEQYAEGKVKGGENHHDQEHERNPSHHAVMDLDCYTTVEELVDVELEKLTKALVALGIQQQCSERLFLTKQARLEKKHSLMDAKMKKLCDLLDEAIERTKQNVEKKRKALTFEVMEEEEAPTDSESLAMGWDGKPIPYWLHKLGLGQEYKCEICGNYSYGGKRAFERHFEEWRHERGLLCLGIKGKVNRITLVEEAKDLWNTLPESQKVRLRADGNLRPLPRLKDQEIKVSNPSQAPTGVAIPPPDIKTMVERTAFFLAREGLETERRVTDKYENEAIFSFLNSSDPYHAFYQYRLTEYRAKNQDATHIQAVAATTNSGPGYGDSQTYLPAEFKVPPPPLEYHKFAYRLPVGMTPEELDIIKLTAQFVARYGEVFWLGFKERVSMDPRFEFIMKPSDGRFTLFSGLVQAYGEVLRPLILKEKLRKKAADMETILENCFHRVQWDRFQKEHWEKKRKEHGEKANGKREEKDMDPGFAHFLVMKQFALRPPKTLEPKRQTCEELALVPEDEFLAQHPGWGRVRISAPHALDAYMEVMVPSLLENVARLKEKIAVILRIPASKQTLSGKAGVLKDDMSLAYYNVGAQEVLTLCWEL